MQNTPLKLKPRVLVTVQSGTEAPHAWHLDTQRLFSRVTVIAFTYLIFFAGTLLFFRELELNRRLEDRVLQLDNMLLLSPKATQAIAVPAPNHAGATVANVQKLAVAPKPVVKPVPQPKPVVDKSPEFTAPAQEMDVQDSSPPASTMASIIPRLTDFTVDCGAESCDVRLSMGPTGTGTAEGALLLILETEVPRIGGQAPTGQLRKRFIIYPGMATQDELAQETIDTLTRKPFKFTRALNTSINFPLTGLLRPLAVNVYIYDETGTLVLHERRQIELDG